MLPQLALKTRPTWPCVLEPMDLGTLHREAAWFPSIGAGDLTQRTHGPRPLPSRVHIVRRLMP